MEGGGAAVSKEKQGSEAPAPAASYASRVGEVTQDAAPKKLSSQELSNPAPTHLGSAWNRASTSRIKGEIDQAPVVERPFSCYNYYYPGNTGSYPQLDDQAYLSAGGGSYNGVQSDNTSHLYYMPGYNPCTTGYMGVDDKQQPCASSGHLQQPLCYSWDSTDVVDVKNGNAAKTGNVKLGVSHNSSLKSNAFNSSKTTDKLESKSTSSLPLNSMLDSGYRSMGLLINEFYPVDKYSSYSDQDHGPFMHYPPVNYRTHGRGWNGNNIFRSRGNLARSGEFEASAEIMRGPRANNMSNSPKLSAESEPEPTNQKEKYNLQDFPSEYENGKFYIIKSYSEDDIHKCIKYNVWSSTRNGNKKLDSAFQDAAAQSRKSNTKCPIFLFFSVNGSGQFAGVAEMLGPVVFNKRLDFCQLDKWNEFFPVKWHIVKDVPNTQLQHIILENNDFKPVTYCRDTQEIGLKQGVEMLNIFKSYLGKTSIFDSFSFYGDREKSLKAKRNNKPASQASDVTTKLPLEPLIRNPKQWCLDTGANYHACSERKMFSTYETATSTSTSHVANDSTSRVLGTGKVVLKMTSGIELVLHDVQHIPDFRINIIAGSLLTKNGFRLVFGSDKVVVSIPGSFVGEGYLCDCKNIFILKASVVSKA